MFRHYAALLALAALGSTSALSVRARSSRGCAPARPLNLRPRTVLEANKEGPDLGELFGGFTAKQRLREEIESPFRKVRIFFFGFSTASALLALYFSTINAGKAYVGGWPDAPPLDDALQSCAINVVAALVCAGITYKDYDATQQSLKRIAQGGRLASLGVAPAADYPANRAALADYRRGSRVLIACGGAAYISTLARSLSADQRADGNTLPQQLAACDLLLVPVLLDAAASPAASPPAAAVAVGDTRAAWVATQPAADDRNFALARAEPVVAFPLGPAAWAEYLAAEVEQATAQGIDPTAKGLIIIVKKNGRILRRATGQPPWRELIGTMDVLDGSKFGMPGDSAKYADGKTLKK